MELLQTLQFLTNKTNETSLVNLISSFENLYPKETSAIFALQEYAYNEDSQITESAVLGILKQLEKRQDI